MTVRLHLDTVHNLDFGDLFVVLIVLTMTMVSLVDPILCSDFSQFMNYLKQNRLIDDRIIHQLNTTIPTQSFSEGVDVGEKCKSLFDVIQQAQTLRNQAVQNCINMQLNKTKTLKMQSEKDPEDFSIRKKLRNEQSTLRLFQQELSIEDIIKQRVQSAFHERCRNYYRADVNT